MQLVSRTLDKVEARPASMGMAWPGLLAVVSVGLAYCVKDLYPPGAAPIPRFAWCSAFVSLTWALVGAVERRERIREALYVVSLLSGVAAALVQCVSLSMRLICVSADLVNGYCWQGILDFGFGGHGLRTLGVLYVACAAGLYGSRDPRLFTCLQWCAVMIGLWASLLLPTYELTPTGGYRRAGNTVAMLACLSAVLTVSVVKAFFLERRSAPRESTGWVLSRARRDRSWPGFYTSCRVLSLACLVLVAYHLAIPITRDGEVVPTYRMLVTGAAGVAAASSLVLALRGAGGALMQAGLFLCALFLCSVVSLFVPFRPGFVAKQYPVLFNWMIVACAVWAFFCAWLSETVPATPGRRRWAELVDSLRGQARRCALLSLSLGVVLGVMMAAWPRLPSISTMDHTLSRVAGGFFAYLVLAGVSAWIAHKLDQLHFHLLWMLSLSSMAGFLLARLLPFHPI